MGCNDREGVLSRWKECGHCCWLPLFISGTQMRKVWPHQLPVLLLSSAPNSLAVILVSIHTSVAIGKSLNRWPSKWQPTDGRRGMPVAAMAHIDLNFIGSIIVFLGTRKSNTLNLPHAIMRGCSALGNWNLEVTGWVKRAVPLLRSLGGKKNTSIVLKV